MNLGLDPNAESHSIKQQVAYWAGGIDPWDRRKSTAVPVRSEREVSTAVTKAACLQAMNDRGAHGNNPIAASLDSQAMRPLIKGASTALEQYFIAKKHEIRKKPQSIMLRRIRMANSASDLS